MIICPNCGAGNKDESTVCRMCAASLEAAKPVVNAREKNATTFPPTVIMAEHKPDQPAATTSASEEVVCPSCQTVNEAGWSFCQQCGSRLAKPSAPEPPPQPPPQPQPPARKSPQGFTTVPSEKPAVEPKAPQGFKTVVARPAAPPPEDKNEKPAVSVAPPEQPSPTPPREAAPPKKSPPPVGLPTVVAEPPVKKPSLPFDQKPEPPAQRQPPPTEQVRSISPISPSGGGNEVACPQCGQLNNQASAYCGGCGSVMSVAKTIVMSSPLPPVEAKLHLVMEGGQSGDTYEIDEEAIIGRASGDITFPHDGFMSGRHARIVRRGNSFLLTDEGSRNGTFIKIKGEVELKSGDMILVGKQLFRFEA